VTLIVRIKRRYAECRYAGRRYVECRGAFHSTVSLLYFYIAVIFITNATKSLAKNYPLTLTRVCNLVYHFRVRLEQGLRGKDMPSPLT